jgi:hypothetical protein
VLDEPIAELRDRFEEQIANRPDWTAAHMSGHDTPRAQRIATAARDSA